MNFKYIITSLALTIATLLTTAQAQMLPEAHTKGADVMVGGFEAQSFLGMAFDNARNNTPFASVTVEADADDVDMELAGRVVDYAAKFLGTRYVLGASGPSAFDCSGFTSYVYRNFGISLNRSSRDQYTQGQRVRKVADMRPGDLLFFSSRSSGAGNVGHVALVVSVDEENNSCTFIHASTKGGVKYQKFPDNGYYSSHYIGAKRVLGSEQVAAR